MNESLLTEHRGAGYRRHAAIARDLAEQCQSDSARTALLEMAQRYERLAGFAERAAVPAFPRLARRPAPVPAASCRALQ